jgi:hypothetical protein
MTYSEYIYKISDWLESIGVKVTRVDSFDTDTVAGRYHYDRSEIEILSCLEARTALLTVAHEAGHHIGALLHRRSESYKREQQAYAYGWKVLRLVGAPISRAEWLIECRDADANYRAKTFSAKVALNALWTELGRGLEFPVEAPPTLLACSS